MFYIIHKLDKCYVYTNLAAQINYKSPQNILDYKVTEHFIIIMFKDNKYEVYNLFEDSGDFKKGNDGRHNAIFGSNSDFTLI